MINYYTKIRSRLLNYNLHLITTALLLVFISTGIKAQLTGIKNIPGDYADLATAITDLNTQGVGAGGVTINLVSGNPQTATAGGYIITASGTSANPIIFEGNGNTITAAANHTVGALTDGIIKLHGADFVTIQNFILQENAANTVTTAASNTMTEWGIALLYSTSTNGAQNNTIQNNTISLNRTYQNTFGVYSNSTHSNSTATTSATATTTAGGNSGLKIYSNNISNVNIGIVVIGPTAVADNNTGIDIGGTTALQGNTITNYGTTGTFSGYANVSGTVNGILVRNSIGFNISNNSITSSNGGVTTGTLNGIHIPASSTAPTSTFTNNINNNTISLITGASAAINGINYPSGSASTTSVLNINNNNFINATSTVTNSGTINLINLASTNLTTSISNNTFSNITTNTTGSFTFISASFTTPANGTKTINNNSIVTAFNKTGAGGTVTLYNDNGSSTTGTTVQNNNNNFSNITLTGATTMAGWSNTDGTGSTPVKTISGNTFANWSCGSSAVNVLQSNFGGSITASNNTISNINGTGSITGVLVGSSGTIASANLFNNNILGLTSTGTGGAVTGISYTHNSTNVNINNNKISSLSSSSTTAVVYGLAITSGTAVNVYNNLIGKLFAPAASATSDAVRGVSLTSTATTSNIKVYYNTIYLDATSTGANFNTSALFHTGNATATTANLDLRNNILINKSVANGTGLTVAFRRANTSTANYNANSNRNIFYAGVPSAVNLIYNDGTTSDQTLTQFKARVASRDDNSQTEDVPFISLDGTQSTFLHVSSTTSSLAESNGISIATFNTDYDGEFRQGDASYTGTGTAPDIGADEFEGIPVPVCSGTPTAGTISGASSVCTGLGTNLSLSGATNALGISYQWASSTTSGGAQTFLGTNSGQPTGNLTNTTYYVVTVTCANSGLSATSPEFTVSVNPNPVVTVTPTSGSYCLPNGTAVNLSANGANSYSWLPTTGLSSITGNSVSATPSATTIFTVTGTDVNGCIGTANTTINVGLFPVVSEISATPVAVCLGANSQLNVNAYVPTNGPASTYVFSGSTGTYSPLVGGTALASGAIGDDVGIGNIPIGFTFNYNGNPFTVFGASSNGLIQLGNSNASITGLSANNLSTNANIIAPLWDDNNTTGGTISYLLTGTSPNQVLTIQYTGMHVGGTGSSTNPTIDLQIKLFESNGVIQFIYGTTSGNFTSTTASIGISGAVGNYLSITPLSPANTSTSSNSTQNSSISSAVNFPSGTIYTFTPPSSPVSQFSWSPSTFLNDTTIANPIASAVNASVNYTVTLTSSIGCSTTGTVAITAGSALSSAATVNATSVCAGSTLNLQATPTGGGAPYTYSWSGPNGFTSIIQNPQISNITTAATGTYSVTITDNCASTSTSQVTITVNALPIVSVNPTSERICLPEGTAVTLTASGAGTYSWLPSAGLSAITGSSVSARPASSTVYTVSGTDANGCINTATSTINIGTNPIVNGVTATPPAVCSGASSQLLANAVERVNGPVSNYTFVASSGAFNSITNGTAISGAIGDDVGVGNLPIGFTFSYNGSLFTTFGVSSNGAIQLGNNTASITGLFTNNLSTNTNIIAPLWDDNNTTGGTVSYLLSGTSPNQTLTIQYLGMHVGGGGSGTNPTIDFQAILHEYDGKIEFIYGPTSASLTGTTASIGISGAAGVYLSVTPLSPVNTSTASSTTNNTGINSAANFPSGTVYTFNPATAPITDFQWSPATYLNNTQISNPLASNILTSLTYSVDIKSSTGCILTRSVAIAAGSPLTSTASSNPVGSICEGSTLSLSATPAGGGAPFTYVWSGPNGFTSTLQNPQITNITLNASGTYTVVTSDNCGATSSAQISISVNPAPSLTINTTQGLICLPGGNAINLSATGANSYSWSPANGLSNTSGNNVSANPSSTTTYTLTGTDALGCTKSINTTISVGNSPLISSVSASPNAVCSAGSSQLEVAASVPVDLSISNYIFTANSGTYTPLINPTQLLGSSNDDTPTSTSTSIGFPFNFGSNVYDRFSVSPDGWLMLGSGTATSQYLNAVTSTTNIPKIYAYWDDMATGSNGSVSYNLEGTSPNKILKVQWNVTIPRSTSGTANSSFQVWLYEANGIIELRYGALGSGSMSSSVGLTNTATDFQSITISNSTSSTTTPDNNNTGQPSNGTIYKFNPPSEPINSITWTPSTFLNNTTIYNPQATGITSSTVYTVTVASILGCTASNTVSISAGQALSSTATASLSNTICEGGNVTLQATPIGGGGPYNFSWTGPNGFTSSAQDTALQNVTLLQSGTYSVTILDDCGATSNSSVQINVNQLPVVTASSNTNAICLPGGTAVNLTANGASSYNWLPTNGLGNAFSSTTSANPNSSTTYTVTGTDANGCTDTALVSIIVSNNPSITATASPDIVCINGTTQLNANAGPTVGNYVYSVSSGSLFSMTGATEVIGSGNDDTPTASPINIGFNFAFGGISYTQCSISPDGWILLGNGTATNQFTNNVTSATNTPKIYPYWDDLATGSNGNVTTLVSGTAPNRIFIVNWFVTIPRNTTGPANSDFQLWLYETDGKIEFHYGNMNNASMSSSVGLTKSSSDFNSVTITGNTNSSLTENNNNPNQPLNGTVYSFVPPAYNYVWSPASFMSDPSIQNPIASSINTNTTFTVIATEISTGCSSSQTVSVSTTPLSNVNLIVSPSALVCEGASVEITAFPVGGSAPFSYSWSPVSSTSDTLNFTATSTQTYTVIATDNCGTSFTKTITINVSPTPTVSVVSSSTSYCNPGNAVQLNASGADLYNWLPIAGLNNSSSSSVSATPNVNTTYTVTGSTNGTGCSSTTTVAINVFATPTVTAIANPSIAICANDTVSLNASANIPITYTQATDTYFSENCGSNAGPVGDDVVSASLPIGFDFNYFGINYTQFAISTNGNIQLGDGSGSLNNPTYSTAFTDVAIPNTANPNNMIALAWDDWLISAGEINYGIIGNAPNRKLVVCFNTTGRGAGLADTLDGQIVLEETTNRVVINMFKKGIQAQNSSTQGLENQTGNSNSTPVPGRQNQAWNVNKETRVFTPYSGTYSYLWTPASNLNDPAINNPIALGVNTTTTFSVLATEQSGCSSTATVTVNVNPLPNINLGQDTGSCGFINSSIILNAYQPNSTYNWNDGSSDSALVVNTAGTYYVTVTDANGCIGSDTINVTDNTPNVSLTLPFASVCVDATANALSGGLPTGGSYSGNGVSGANFDASIHGIGTATIQYIYTDAVNGCSDTASSTVVVDPCIGIKDLTQVTDWLEVYPNPTSGKFTLIANEQILKNSKIELLTTDGKLVISKVNNFNNSIEFNLENYPNAVYFLKIYTSKEIKVMKIVKQE